MKKFKIILLSLLALVIVLGGYFIYALYINPKSPYGNSIYNTQNNTIEVDYYRPYKKNRLIFGEKADGALVPYGEYWRLGANFTTTLSTKESISLAGRQIEPGTYGMYTYPYAENWVLVLHEKASGLSAAEPDPSGILMKINVPVQTLDAPVEQLTIDFVDNFIRMRWDTTQVVLSID